MKKLLLSLVLVGSAANAQWTEQATGFSEVSRGINEINIVDANIIWAIAYDGTDTDNDIQEFTRTTDGGENWTAGTIELFDPLLAINNISAIDGMTAWISVINGDEGGGAMYMTADGGEIWDFFNPTGSFEAASSFQNVVHFFDANNGLVQGDPVAGEFEIYTTSNGGFDWTAVPAANIPNPQNANEFGYNGGNFAVGDIFWFPTSVGNIYRSVDKGLNWTKIDTPIADFGGAVTSTSSGQARFSDINNGIIISTANATSLSPTYTLSKTTDGGATWTPEPYTSGYLNFDYIPGTSMLIGIKGSTPYSSAYSTDNGSTWTEIDADVQRTAVSFLNGTTGWAGGFNQDDSTGGIYKYTGPSLGVNAPAISKISVSPNPTSGLLQIANDNSSITNVVAFDLLGKQVYSKNVDALNNVEIDLSALNSGAYFVRVTDNTGVSQTTKIIKN